MRVVVALLGMAVFCVLVSLLLAEPSHDGGVLERFTISGDGDPLIVPVTIKGRQYPFMVDTGASRTIYDTSLRHLLGSSRGRVNLKGVRGEASLERFGPPDAFVGSLPLPRIEPIYAADLSGFRESSELEVRGMLGMDFLKHHIMRIDFDAHTLTFDRSIGSEPGLSLPLHSNEMTDRPYVDAYVSGCDLPHPFQVDTGALGVDGLLAENLYERLSRFGKVARLGQVWSLSHGHEGNVDYGKLACLKLGSFEHCGLAIEPARLCCLGLSFLSRYQVTFDFPAACLYLRKGEQFHRPTSINRSGLLLRRISGKLVVTDVQAKSPAAEAGIKVDDEILSIAGQSAKKTRKPKLGNLLSEASQPVSVELKRFGSIKRVWLALKPDR
jgi:hypothetical protein